MNRVYILIIVVLTIIVGYFGFQHFQNKKQMEEMQKKLEMAESPFNTTSEDSDPQFQDRDDVVKGDITTMKFDKETHNFGTINEGQKYSTVFKVKNTGDKPLFISDAIGSCGCTVPEYSKEPIAPNQEGEMKVTFDAKGKEGEQQKTVTIVTNTKPSKTTLFITAKVIR